MKGLVVVICAPSQFGKDTVAEKMIQFFPEYFRGGIEASYATVYKVRERRQNDPEHIKCVKTYEEIPTAKDDRLETTVYGNLNIVYDKKEIEKKLENGEVVFIATTSTDLSRKLKNEFKEQCFSVVMKGVPIDERKMVREDLRRYYNVSYHDATEQQISESKKRISKRLEDFEKAMQRFESFLQDEELGPDYVFKNWFHFLEKFSCLKDLDGRIGDRNDHEFEMLLYNIFCVYDRINRNKEWKQQFSLSKEKREELQGKLFTMWDSYSEYVRNNNSKE